MPDAFDDPDAEFLMLVNEWDQHSLWPVFAAVPAGWAVLHGPASREDCLRRVPGGLAATSHDRAGAR
ncbi:MbtH family protein [Actinoplanes sp. G11-F43]|uniref:MbtH family protein n=1 Tax=Actinoplanes sp. G11-F43 TaxID=3424130 RepID=UPI003D3596E2